MSSREEEKRQRRVAREAAEAEFAAQQARTRQLRHGLGAVVTIVAVVGLVLALTGGSNKPGTGRPKTPGGPAAHIPAPGEPDLSKAAAIAGCELKNLPSAGQSHVTGHVDYKSNPPTSGDHSPVPALDGIYPPASAPTAEHAVHALEHGRVDLQYRLGTPVAKISQLETLVSEELNGKAGYKTLLFQNTTKMPYAVAATAWTQLLGCPAFTPKVFDALRDFRVRYVDKGPEPGIPPTN